MNKQNVKPGFFEEQLGSVQISQRERSIALHEARIAELFVDAVIWSCGKAQQLAADVRPADAEVLGR